MEKLSQRLDLCLGYALYFGLFVLVGGYFTSPDSSTHHTQLYIGFFIPAVAALLWHSPQLLRDLRQDRGLQCFTLLLAWLAITVSWTTHPDKAHLYKLLGMTWIFVMAIRLLLDNPRLFNTTMSISLGVASIVVLVTLIIYFQAEGTSFYLSRLDQFGERTVPAIVVGKISAVCLMFCLMQERLNSKPSTRIAFTAMALVFLLPLILSFSRTAMVALFVTALWYFLQNRNTRASVIVAGTTVLLLTLMLMDNNSEWLTNISRSATVEIRLWGWRVTWQEIIQAPWFGHGLQAPLVVDWRDTPFLHGVEFHHTHNLLLTVWYEAGVVGLVLLLALFGLIASKLRPLMHIAEVRYWSYIAIFALLASQVDSPTLIDRPAGDWLWFWLPLAMLINIDKLAVGTVAVPSRSGAANESSIATPGKPGQPSLAQDSPEHPVSQPGGKVLPLRRRGAKRGGG